MVSSFYQKYNATLLLLVALSFPVLVYQAQTLPVNNDIETWLPRGSDTRAVYNEFKQLFGAEEIILVGISNYESDDPLMDALARRIERVPGVRTCWSPARLRAVMEELSVSDDEIQHRLRGFLVSKNGACFGLVAQLSKEGIQNRAGVVAEIRNELEYCQLQADDIHVAGGPVVVAELNRLGSEKNNKGFFVITLFICFCLLYFSLRNWKLSLTIVGLTVWAINLTTAAIKWAGGERNFLLGALSVMVMVFTLAIAVHFIHYYRSSRKKADPLGEALRLAWKPCCLATLTTTIGLISLTISDIGPVRQFGYAASIGSIVALLTGLGLTPAALARWPLSAHQGASANERFSRAVNWLLGRRKSVMVLATLVVLPTSAGLIWLESKIDSLDFLPRNSKVLADVKWVDRELTSAASIEAYVDFSGRDMRFAEKLDEVRRLELVIAEHASVRHTMSVASFFPTEMPASPFETARLLKKARSRQRDSSFLADGDRLWRISARISPGPNSSRKKTLEDLVAMTQDAPITFTGLAPLMESAQQSIFDGFWESFAMAFGIISLVMIISLRSVKLGAVAMIPNLTPIFIVFGALGWMSFPVDIGMMMTGSIALGIAVDGTFHFLVRYEKDYQRTGNASQASRAALLQTGVPILEAAVIASIGMMALTLSNFRPTARFGYMMATLLMAALIGDVVILPVILSFRRNKAPTEESPETPRELKLPPHFLDREPGSKPLLKSSG